MEGDYVQQEKEEKEIRKGQNWKIENHKNLQNSEQIKER